MQYLKVTVLCFCALLAYIFVGGIVWIPFVLFAIFFLVVKFSGNQSSNVVMSELENVEPGTLGEYVVDGETVYGLYLCLAGKITFVDIRRDALVRERANLAMQLFERQSLLSSRLSEFLEKYDDFDGDEVDSLGVHSDERERIEVFWVSGKYTLLRDMQFVLE